MMYDSLLLDVIDEIYNIIDIERECGEDIINILIQAHCYVSKRPRETEDMQKIRHQAVESVVRAKVQHIINASAGSSDWTTSIP